MVRLGVPAEAMRAAPAATAEEKRSEPQTGSLFAALLAATMAPVPQGSVSTAQSPQDVQQVEGVSDAASLRAAAAAAAAVTLAQGAVPEQGSARSTADVSQQSGAVAGQAQQAGQGALVSAGWVPAAQVLEDPTAAAQVLADQVLADQVLAAQPSSVQAPADQMPAAQGSAEQTPVVQPLWDGMPAVDPFQVLPDPAEEGEASNAIPRTALQLAVLRSVQNWRASSAAAAAAASGGPEASLDPTVSLDQAGVPQGLSDQPPLQQPAVLAAAALLSGEESGGAEVQTGGDAAAAAHSESQDAGESATPAGESGVQETAAFNSAAVMALEGSAPAAEVSGSTPAASSPTVPLHHVEEPVPMDQVTDLVVEHLSHTPDGDQAVTLRLHPAQLGEVRLQIHVSGREVQTVFEVTNAEARQALEQQGEQLRQGLSQAGFTLSGFTVSTGSGGRQAWERRELEELLWQGRLDRPSQSASSPVPQVRRPAAQAHTGVLDRLA